MGEVKEIYAEAFGFPSGSCAEDLSIGCPIWSSESRQDVKD